MNINKHNVAMRWITRRRTNEVAGLYESFPGTFSAYQEALSSGFQGTMEEFMQIQSIPQGDRPFTGKVGGLVEPRVGFKDGDKAEKVRKFIKGKPNLNETVIKNYLKKIGYSESSSAFAGLKKRGVFKDVVIDAPIKTFSKETLRMKNAVIEYNELITDAVKKKDLSKISDFQSWYKKENRKNICYKCL